MRTATIFNRSLARRDFCSRCDHFVAICGQAFRRGLAGTKYTLLILTLACAPAFAQNEMGRFSNEIESQARLNEIKDALDNLIEKFYADQQLTRQDSTLKMISQSIQQMQMEAKLPAKAEKKSILQVGLSLGPRWIKVGEEENRGFVEASISPLDSTLQVDKKDKSAVVLAAVLTVTPFKNISWPAESWHSQSLLYLVNGLSYIASVNLIDLSSVDNFSIRSQSIEGGIGMGFKLNDKFSIGFTFDRVFNRRLRDNILRKEGEQLKINDEVINELNPEDNKLFRNDNLRAVSLKFIYHI